jgi:hypothetical protein
MSLVPNFALTPRNSYFYGSTSDHAAMAVYGATFYPNYGDNYRYSFDKQHENDELYFSYSCAGDSTINFLNWSNRQKVPRIELLYDLSSFGVNKELALIFGFDATSKSRVLIYSDTEQLGDVTLNIGDNQFLIEIETVDYMNLYFLHVQNTNSAYGGTWFFRGITGYVI